MAKKALVVDLNRCVNCLACMSACKAENNVEIGKYWTWVDRVGPTGKFPNNQMYYVPKMCQHCDTPECITVCPTAASYKREDGIVLVDKEKCIGCEQCIDACPYNARIMNSETSVAEKCTLCSQLTDKGEQPNCVVNCPGKARKYGDLSDPKSEVSAMVKAAGKEVYKLKDVGNKPVGAYILRKQTWQEQK